MEMQSITAYVKDYTAGVSIDGLEDEDFVLLSKHVVKFAWSYVRTKAERDNGCRMLNTLASHKVEPPWASTVCSDTHRVWCKNQFYISRLSRFIT